MVRNSEARICINTQSSYTVTKKKRTSSLARSICHTGTGCVKRSGDVSSVGTKTDREALQNNINKLLDVRNLKDLHLKHYHMSSAQFKKRTTHEDIP